MRSSNRDENDSDAFRKGLGFTDETLPVISCKEVVHKDPMFVLHITFRSDCDLSASIRSSHSVNASVQTKFEVKLEEVECQSVKRKEREVRVKKLR